MTDRVAATGRPSARVIARRRITYGLSTWFRTPPRRHGEVGSAREVSFLELFYDLVYVVLIGGLAHHLATHLQARAIAEFAVLFGLVWLAWFNGTFWHELHGREDGRSRNYIFAQMGLLALLAVFAGEATGKDGPEFAVTYGLLFAVLTWQWWQVHRIDTDERYRPTTVRYIAGMVVSTLAILASAFLGGGARIVVWTCVVVAWTVGGHILMASDRTEGFGDGVTASLVERMGLFTIIVLGEVVVGVVGGMSAAEDRTPKMITTGMVGLTIGMGIWWNYFDMLGRRVPGRRGVPLATWVFAHLPLAMSIAGGGAAVRSLVANVDAARTAATTAWLLAGSVAVTLGAIALACKALPRDEFPRPMTRWIVPTFSAGAAITLVIGLLRPASMVLAITTSAVLFLVWLVLFAVYLAAGGDPEVRDFELGHDGPPVASTEG